MAVLAYQRHSGRWIALVVIAVVTGIAVWASRQQPPTVEWRWLTFSMVVFTMLMLTMHRRTRGEDAMPSETSLEHSALKRAAIALWYVSTTNYEAFTNYVSEIGRDLSPEQRSSLRSMGIDPDHDPD